MAESGPSPAEGSARPWRAFDSDSLIQAAHLLGDNPIFVVEWQTRRILSCNDAVERVFGHRPSELIGGDTRSLYVSEDAFHAVAADADPHFARGATSYHARLEMRRGDGTAFPTETLVQVVQDSHNGPVAVIAVVRDLTEHVPPDTAAMPAFRYAEPHWLAMEVPGAIFQRVRSPDGEDRYSYIAGRLLEGHGIDFAAAQHDPAVVFDHIEPSDRSALEQAMLTKQSTLAALDMVVRFRPPEGDQLWLRVISRPHRGADGAVIWDGLALDITREKRAEASAHWYATHDSLTGLSNRSRFVDRLGQALEHARAKGRHVAVAHVGVRGMMQLNETHGFGAGDELLRQFGVRLQEYLSAGDIVARSHGDIFLVMLDIAEGVADLGEAIGTLRAVCAEPFVLGDGVTIRTESTIGVARFPEDGGTADELVRAATLAAGRAHARPAAGYAFYAQELSDELQQRFELERQLREAIAQQDLEPHFQPQIALADGAVVGLEALVRWPLPDGRMASPAEFIPLAEQTGLIDSLGALVLRRVAACVAEWLDRGVRVPPVAVNCSAHQFRGGGFVATYRREITECGLEPAAVALEITESTLVEDFAATEHIMMELRGAGVRFAIDDFGTGFSSLAYLTRLPFHVLKIDRSFVAGVCTDARKGSIVKALIDMARALDLYVIAEGVETADHEAEVRRLGCDAAQGFLYSAALPAHRVERWLT